MSDSKDILSTRLVQIIIKLNNSERFTINELVEEFQVSVRTIQRDINERLSFLPIIKENGFYRLESYALGKLSFEDIKSFATLSGIKSLYPSLSHEFLVDILNSKINSTYIIKNQGFEDVSHKQDTFEHISVAIVKKSPINFFYNDKQREINPYVLVNNNGIWYLLGDENDQLKTYTFSKIKEFSWDDKKHFIPNEEFTKIIAKNNTNWFSQDSIEVVLEIDKEAIEYFLRRETLPNKKIIEQDKEKLILSTKVSYDDEILRVVKYWLPYIKIISPKYLQEKFEDILKNYLK